MPDDHPPTPDDPPRTGSDDGVRCRICGRALHRPSPVCFCCRTVARQLGLPLVPIVVVREYRVGDADHRRLRGYKDAPTREARRHHRQRLVEELAEWTAGNGDALDRRLGSWTVVTAVPSTRRPGPSPAGALLDGVPELAARHLPLLRRGRGAPDHLTACRNGFAPAPGVDRVGLDGMAVLVFDDSVTTGARAQSAAAALRLTGVRVVGILAVGRALPADRPTVGQTCDRRSQAGG